jgi:Spy/CpxP family protein refolding chaperone
MRGQRTKTITGEERMKLSVIKMLALGVALTVTAPWIASAADEGGKGGPGGGRGRGEWLQAALDKLNLSDDQKAKIKDIMDKAAADRQEFMKEHADELKAAKDSGDRDKMRSVFAPMREKMKATMEQIKALLTDEQKQKLAESMPAHGDQGKKQQ